MLKTLQNQRLSYTLFDAYGSSNGAILLVTFDEGPIGIIITSSFFYKVTPGELKAQVIMHRVSQ